MKNKIVKLAAALAVVAVIYTALNIFVSGEKFCRMHWIYDADSITVNVSQDVGQEFVSRQLSAEERQQLENRFEGMRLMKVFSKEYYDVDSLQVTGIYCYKNGELSEVVTVLGNSYIKTVGGDRVYKIME